MTNKFKSGDRVRLNTFLNNAKAPIDIEESENYWKLIGLTGRIVGDKRKIHPAYKMMGEQVLVQFDDSVTYYGLHCHNDEACNALWLFLTDLELIE